MPHRSILKSEVRSLYVFGIVFTKKRYMIVVDLHEVNYIEVPLRIKEYQSLKEQEHYKHESVSVRDGCFWEDNSKSISRFGHMVIQSAGPFIDKSSIALFAHPIVRNYNLAINYCRDPTEESAKRLGRSMKHKIDSGLED